MKRQWILLVVLLLLPAIALPFVGEHFDFYIRQMQDSSWANDPVVVSTSIILILASDLLLPIPSSMVNTWAGGTLGVFLGSIVCWIGMSIGAWIGYLAGWYCGNAAVKRFTSDAEQEQTNRLILRSGIWALLGLRALPVLAEASVLIVGSYRMPSRKFWMVVAPANLVIAITYSVLGYFSRENEWFVIAIYLSIAIPVITLIVLRARWIKNQAKNSLSEQGKRA